MVIVHISRSVYITNRHVPRSRKIRDPASAGPQELES